MRVGGVGLSLALSVVLARLMGPVEYGRYAYVTETMLFLSMPVALGLPNLLTREVSRYSSNGEIGLLRGILHWSLRFVVVLGLSAILVTAGIVFVASSDPRERALFLIGLPIVVLHGIGQIRMGALRGLRQPVKAQLPDAILRPAFILLAVTLAYLYSGREVGAVIGVLSMDVALGVAFGVGMIWLGRALRPQISDSDGVEYNNRIWRREALPFFLLGGTGLINSKVSLVLCGFFLPPADVGYYKIAITAGTLVAFVLSAVNATISPLISELFSRGRIRELQKVLRSTVIGLFASSALVAVVYGVFGRAAIRLLYGPEFVAAYSPLMILTVGQLVNTGAGSVGPVLNMTGHQISTLKGQSISAASAVVLGILLIPTLGIQGAALSTAASLILWNVLLLRILRRLSPLKTSILQVLRPQAPAS